MTTPDFSLIIPTLQERESIISMLDKVEFQLTSTNYEIIVVDDDSPDGTASLVQTYALSHPRVRLHVRSREKGLSGAVIRGMAISRGRILGVMDADLSHDETLLRTLLRAIDEGADLAIGSRRVAGGGADHWPWYRRLMSDFATRLSIYWLKLPLLDPMSGFFVLRRPLYERCKDQLAPQGYKILLEIYCHVRPVKHVEIPFVFKDRRQGHSKVSLTIIVQFLQSLLRLRGIRQSL